MEPITHFKVSASPELHRDSRGKESKIPLVLSNTLAEADSRDPLLTVPVAIDANDFKCHLQ